MNTKWNRAYVKADVDMLVHAAGIRSARVDETKGLVESGSIACGLHREPAMYRLELVFAPDDLPVTCIVCMLEDEIRR